MKHVILAALLVSLGCSSSNENPPGSGGAGGSAGRGGSAGSGRGGTGGGTPGTGGGSTAGTGGTAAGGAGGGSGGSAGGAGGGSAGGAGGGAGAGGAMTGSGGSSGDGPAAEGGMGGSPAAGNPFVYVSTGAFSGNSLNIYQLDMQTGVLAPKGSAMTGSGPTYAAFHPNGKHVYVLNEGGGNRIEAFNVNRQTGALTKINDAASGGMGPAHLSVSRNGKWVYTANYTSGHVGVLPVNAQGGVGAPVDTQKAVPGQAHHVIDDPAGKYVFVSSTSADRVVQYILDDATGKLTPNDPAFVPGGGANPRHMAFHPNATAAYVAGEGGGRVVHYGYDAATGKLAAPGTATNVANDGTHVLVHPNGKFLYASFRGGNRLAVFAIAANGSLMSIQQMQQGVAGTWDFTIDPTGTFLLVANNGNGTVRVFRIAADTGMLSLLPGSISVSGPHFVGVLP